MMLAVIAILSIIIINQISTAIENETEEDSDLLDGNSSNLTEDESFAADRSVENEELTVHVYVTNNDNERLKVSLFIDSKLIDSKEIKSNSEEKIDSYSLSPGPHSFKITWWDEDIKQSMEMEETREIYEETAINLYTTLHDEPDKYEITVNLVNDNPHDLKAFLYVDGKFEKSKDAKKESSTELGSVKLEEGVHNLSVRWQDTKTRIEYEKERKITVRQDEAVLFYAPAGVSFQSVASSSLSNDDHNRDAEKSNEDAEKSNKDAEKSNKDAEKSNKDAEKSNKDAEKSNKDDKNISIKDNGKDEPEVVEDAAESVPAQSSSKSGIAASSNLDYSEGSIVGRSSEGHLSGSIENTSRLYLYGALVILAVYLIQRR
mgnify:CR=1 FL=1